MDRALRLCGLACVGAGVALLAAGLLVPRLIDGAIAPRWAVLTGLPLVGAGLVLIRRHWSAPAAPAVVAACALVPAAIGFAAAYAATDRTTPLADLALATVELPGFTIDLPAGEVTASSTRYTVGTHERSIARGGTVQVRWISMGPMAADELERSARALAQPASLRVTLDVDLGPDPVFAGVFDADGPVGFTAAYCRDAGQMVIVATMVAGSATELGPFHRRISGSIHCGAGIPRSEREVLLPSFPAPGVGYLPDTQPATFAGVDGSVYTFHPTIGDASQVLRERPGLLAEMVEAMGVEVTAESRDMREVGGRIYASLTAGEGAASFRVTVTAFYCPELGLSFFAQHQGPAAAPADYATDALALAACPVDGENPVTADEAFTRSCNGGDGMACYLLARGIASHQVDAAGRDPVELAARACKLGVSAACPPPPQGESK